MAEEALNATKTQTRNQGGCMGCVRILVLNIQVKECSRLN